ncbi:InlB B-repeat-containing protein [Oceanobacillus halophilus]|nr:tetratricopeptide repeat protein [Oceanobacillus halophilus]
MNRKSIIFTLLGVLTIGVAIFFTVQVVQSESPTDSFELAEEALDNEEYEKSVELFKEILKEDASNTEARIGLASAYMGLSKYDDAIDTLNEGIRLKPKETQFYYFLSLAYEGKSDLPGAINAFEEGIDATNDTALTELFELLESNLEIAVERHYVQAGHNRNLVLEWTKNDGSVIPVEAEWEVDDPSQGELDNTTTTSVTFTAEETGTAEITATVGSITKETELHIEEQVVEEMNVTPEEIDPLSIGQEIAVSVTGVDADGEEMEINPEWATSEDIVKFSDTEGQQVSIETTDEGISTITLTYQELEEEINLVVEGENKHIKTDTEGQGTVTVSPNETTYTTGSEVTLEANPAAGWEFVRWDGDVTGTNNPLSITVENSMSVKAIFKETGHHELTLSISGGGNILRDSLNSTYADNETITLVAQADAGWKFSGWRGSVSGSNSRINVLMDGDKDIQAVFVRDGVSYDSSESAGSNSTSNNSKDSSSKSNSESSSKSKKDKKEDTKNNDSSPKDDSNNSTDKEDNKEKEEIEEEKPEQSPDEEKEVPVYSLTTEVKGKGMITASQTSAKEGSTIRVEAHPAEGMIFAGWIGDLLGNAKSRTITMNGNKKVIAIFEPDPAVNNNSEDSTDD